MHMALFHSGPRVGSSANLWYFVIVSPVTGWTTPLQVCCSGHGWAVAGGSGMLHVVCIVGFQVLVLTVMNALIFGWFRRRERRGGGGTIFLLRYFLDTFSWRCGFGTVGIGSSVGMTCGVVCPLPPLRGGGIISVWRVSFLDMGLADIVPSLCGCGEGFLMGVVVGTFVDGLNGVLLRVCFWCTHGCIRRFVGSVVLLAGDGSVAVVSTLGGAVSSRTLGGVLAS